MTEREHEADTAQLSKSVAGLNIQLPDDMRAEPVDVATFWLWPENVRAWGLFLSCSTQWRVSMDGREGLDYPAVDLVLGRSGLRPRQRLQAWHHIQAMEFACLRVWAERKREQ